MRGLLLFFAVLLMGCASAPGPERRVNTFTGVSSFQSELVVLFRERGNGLAVRAFAMSVNGEEEFGLLTYVVRSDGNYPKIESAWTLDDQLDHRMGDRWLVDCGFPYSCRKEEIGSVAFARDDFEDAAAGDGFPILLIGKRGSYAGKVPVRLFDQVLDLLPED